MSQLLPYQRPSTRIATPCGRLEVQYYEDVQAPDEQTTVDELVLHGAPELTRSPRGPYVLHICDPRTDGFGLDEFRVAVLSTPLEYLKLELLRLPHYAETVRLQRSYDLEMKNLRRKGAFPTGDEQWVRLYKDVQSRSARDRQRRLETKRLAYEELELAFYTSIKDRMCRTEPARRREGRKKPVVIGADKGDRRRAVNVAGRVDSPMVVKGTVIDSMYELG